MKFKLRKDGYYQDGKGNIYAKSYMEKFHPKCLIKPNKKRGKK